MRQIVEAIGDLPLPAAVIDLDAVDRNAKTLLAAMGTSEKSLRLASKSVRVPWVLRRLLDSDPRIRGLMTYSARETALLAGLGFRDLLIAYPIARPDDAQVIAGLCADGVDVIAMIDDAAQARVLSAAAKAAGTSISVGVDVDVSLQLAGLHLGVRRSPIRDAAAAVALATACRELGGLTVAAVMAYEAQVAGLSDGGKLYERPVKRWIKARSRPLAASRRAEVVAALRAAGFPVRVVNGGGTGSIASTVADAACTEITAGSGFFCPHLFDGYDGLNLEPAAFLAISVVRRSDPGFVTCFGGGVVASGAAGPDRLPNVVFPDNLAPLDLEGFGEVQTPLRVIRGEAPAIGSIVLLRPAKAGEWLERFAEVAIVQGGRVIAREATYRGLGGAFG